jgi:hypothetical protein
MSRDRPKKEASQLADNQIPGVTRGKSRRLFHELYEISETERLGAKRRQRKLWITPIKTEFKKASELHPQINAALQCLWDAGSLGEGRVDPVLRRLYTMVQKGLSCLTQEDFIRFSKLSPEGMRAVGRWLIRSETFAQATWNARQEQEKYEHKKVRVSPVSG